MLNKQTQGMISIERTVEQGLIKNATLGIQISDDGRIWICLNGQAWIRANPVHIPQTEDTDEGRLHIHINSRTGLYKELRKKRKAILKRNAPYTEQELRSMDRADVTTYAAVLGFNSFGIKTETLITEVLARQERQKRK